MRPGLTVDRNDTEGTETVSAKEEHLWNLVMLQLNLLSTMETYQASVEAVYRIREEDVCTTRLDGYSNQSDAYIIY